MRSRLLCISTWVIFVASSLAEAQTGKKFYLKALTKRLDFIFKDEKLKKTRLGVDVFSLSNQERLYSINPNLGLSPASAIKLLTGYVALKKLGPDFTFRTKVYTDGKIRSGKLRGNLYLVGGGDPALVTERMYKLVEQLLRWGIREVEGNIYVDGSIFDDKFFDEHRIDNNKDRAYSAPVSGLSFNYNTTTLFFRPGALGAPVRVYVSPDTGYIKLKNNSKTHRKGRAYNIQASRVPMKGHDLLRVSRGVPVNLQEKAHHFSVSQPAIYAGHALKYFLKQKGVRFSKTQVLKKKLPSRGVRRLLVFNSLPLREIVVRMNKFSNNFMADSLVKALAVEFKGRPGTMEKGLDILREEASLMGVNGKGFRLVSGSGLTRKNRITAAHFTQIINQSFLEFNVLPELLTSLPIAARDGTLRSRMKRTSAEGRLRAKTGTIFGVSSLVGMVQSKGGELLAFTVLMNDHTQVPGSLRPWQNYLGQALADFNRTLDAP